MGDFQGPTVNLPGGIKHVFFHSSPPLGSHTQRLPQPTGLRGGGPGSPRTIDVHGGLRSAIWGRDAWVFGAPAVSLVISGTD